MDTENRIQIFQNYLQKQGIDTAFVFNPDLQFYLTGFKALLYSRPIVLHLNQEYSSIIVPGLEETHSNEVATVDNIYVYYEHPNAPNETKTYLQYIEKITDSMKSKIIGLDMQTTPSLIYQLLIEKGFQIKDVGMHIIEMKYIKTEQELDALRTSSKLVDIAVKESLASVREGITELEIDAAGNKALFEITASNYPNATLSMFSMSPSGPLRSTMPHVFSNTRQLEKGDIMIHSRQVGLNGYRSELERTIIMGTPTELQNRALQSATDAQLKAMEYIKAGVTAASVDKVARDIFERDGFSQYAIHRTGHGIGVSEHEEPYLRFDNNLILKEGMVFTIEPGIYITNVGGFRHSDTVIVTKDGCEVITNYSHKLRDLIYN